MSNIETNCPCCEAFLVIDRVTFRDAAAHSSALWMLFYGTATVLPFLAGYTVFAYRVFGGKVKELTYD